MKFYCVNCDNKKPLKAKKTRKKFDISGLDGVTITGVIHHHCNVCGEDYYDYGDVQKLNAFLAHLVAKKIGRLSGAEMRFLRKYLGYSSVMFAEEILKIDRSTLSRIEKGANEFSETLEQLVRTLALTKSPDRNYDIHDQIMERTKLAKQVVINRRGEAEFRLSAGI